MSRIRQFAAAALAASVLVLPAAISPAGAAPAGEEAAELVKVIVALDGDLTDGLRTDLENVGVVHGFELRSIDAVAATLPAEAVAAVRGLPGVRAVTAQRRLELHLYRSKEQINALGVAKPENYEHRGETYRRPGVTGKGVTVGVIDSGIFAEHPGFGGRVVKGLNFEFSEVPDSTGIITPEQWDAYAEGTGASALQDEVGHGTHVAGTVGGDGSGAQSERNLAGVAPEVEFISLKIASAANGVIEDVGFEENAMAAIDYLIRHPDLGVKLTNNSWGLLETEPGEGGLGEPTDFDAANAMVEKASAKGITMVFSAGNDGPEPGTINKDPGGTPAAITVAAACKGTEEGQGGSCPAGEITEFSSRGTADGDGPQVDVSAPGDQILAPVSPVSILTPLTECLDPAEPLYYCISGTSMASPHVAGVVALMQQVNPDLTPAQAEHCLETTAVDMLAAGVDIHSGHGMVDTRAALRCAYALTNPSPLDQDPGVGAPGGGGSGEGVGSGDDSRTADDDQSLPATGARTLVSLVGLTALASGLMLGRKRRASRD